MSRRLFDMKYKGMTMEQDYKMGIISYSGTPEAVMSKSAANCCVL